MNTIYPEPDDRGPSIVATLAAFLLFLCD